jgi:predicted nucleic acid-binding protein
LAFRLSAIRRRLKPERHAAPLARRPDAELPFADPKHLPPGAAVLLDTCVYLDAAADRLPDGVAGLLARSVLHHSSVCLAELTYGLGALDPRDRRSRANGQVLEDIIVRAQESGRIVVPDDATWGTAGMLAGMLARLQGYGREQRRKALLDSLLLLSALKSGLTLLTANFAEFDLMLQLLPAPRVAFYHAT